MINQYFQSQAGIETEQKIIQDMATEVIQIKGLDVIYIPRELNLTAWDNILHEAPLSTFSTFYPIEMLVENAEGFGDEQEIAAKFGLMIDQEIEFSVSIPRFTVVTDMTHPYEGDLIYYEPTRSLFEITHLQDEVNFKTLNKFTTFKIKAKLFQYSEETIATGIDDIDDLMDNERKDAYADNELFDGMANNPKFLDSRPPETTDILGGF